MNQYLFTVFFGFTFLISLSIAQTGIECPPIDEIWDRSIDSPVEADLFEFDGGQEGLKYEFY